MFNAILLYTPGISEGRETEGCKTKTSMKFGYFQVAFNARSHNLENAQTTHNLRKPAW